ncbi:MAG: hypothetical protein ACKOCN_10315 [Planctomycetaceae bacterium]
MLANDRPDQGVLGHVLCEHRDLHAALSAVRSLLREPERGDGTAAERLKGEVIHLREHVSSHFHQEEQGGFMEESAVRLPRLARRVREVLAEHPLLLAELDGFVAESRALSDKPLAGRQGTWKRLAARFEAFSRRLLDHERQENAVVQEGYNEDFGLVE